MVERIRHGQDGIDGLSAFEIAQAKGFTGTPDEWLASLRGVPGSDGRDGIDGKDVSPDEVRGLIALAVADIPTPVDGINGKEGDRGPRGPRGERGKDGTPAVLPPIVPWDAIYLRDEDTLLTHRILAGPADGSAPRIRLDVVRRADQLIDRIELFPEPI